MSRVVVRSFSISLDGYGAGPDQSLEHPLGVKGETLHKWAFATQTFRKMFGQDGGSTGVDEKFAAASFDNLGAWILGRNMFGPIRGEWPDDAWKVWWGDEPPYHVRVFVLTNHPRASFDMKGGTTFHFITGGIDEALQAAKAAAGGKDVRLGGGVSTIRQYLQEQVIDELHLAQSPLFLGKGENLFFGIDRPGLGYQCSETVRGENATHLVIGRAP